MQHLKQTVENAAVLPRFNYVTPSASPVEKICGCGRIAVYAVYAHKEPHCKLCMYDAIDCDEQVLVGRL